MVQSKAENGYRSRTRTNTRRVFWWNVAWVAATALMAFGPKFLWNLALGLTLLGVGINVATGVGMLLATKKYVMELDDLQRKVYLNALAITVGVTLIAGIPYSVLNLYHLVPFQADIAHLVMLMSATFLVSFLYGTWRYR